jgi:SAM-dependent methyltransferase
VVTLEELIDQELLICPSCTHAVRPGEGGWICDNSECEYSRDGFPVLSGKPALVDFSNSVLDANQLHSTGGASQIERKGLGPKLVEVLYGSNSVAPVAVKRMIEALRPECEALGRRPRILVIGGGAVGNGLEEFYSDSSIDVIAFDIYMSPFVQFIGDGHSIPLADGSIDGVVIQAVLEHVVEPFTVAQEIRRVLRVGGIVYADTPFMQQVHEGPYDFCRFTDSGHRYLFRDFERIDSGTIAGAGTALMWSIRYFARALTRSAVLGGLIGHCFFWLRYTDAILDRRFSLDAASSVFFLGRKRAEPITHAEIISYYQGAMALDQ